MELLNWRETLDVSHSEMPYPAIEQEKKKARARLLIFWGFHLKAFVI